jgi:uncharacterized membrane protein
MGRWKMEDGRWKMHNVVPKTKSYIEHIIYNYTSKPHTPTSPMKASRFLNAPVKWAVGSWSLFIAENFILSENRTTLISHFGDDNYHYIYGLCSTAAVSSIAYGYQYKIKGQGPMLWKAGAAVPLPGRIAAFLCTSIGLGLISQTAPKLQIPLEFTGQSSSEGRNTSEEKMSQEAQKSSPINSNDNSKWKVRCPFDFTDAKSHSLEGGVELQGLDRITRHPGLWSFGLVGMGLSYMTPSLPTRAWLFMPVMVALIGGEHTDGRHRRGMGGNLSLELDEKTSNFPFLAIFSGKQGSVPKALGDLYDEIKGLNGLIAIGLAASFVASKGRGSAGRSSRLRTSMR